MKLLSLTLLFSFAFISANSQKGTNDLQGTLHYGIPVGNLADVSNRGWGGALKGLYGFSTRKQHVSLSVGYTNFPVKKSLAGDYRFFYSTLPVMTGYRYTFGKNINKGIYLESQAGINFNKVKGFSTGITGPIFERSGTNFIWAFNIGYEYKGFEFGVQWQSAEVEHSSNEITFIGIHFGFSLFD